MEAVKFERNKEEEESSTDMLTWQSHLPTTVLRVLLVEADDSTRHVITALLQKCNYRVVSVSDGLSAWETIKMKHSKIDLILTEAELPSVSGFALLSLVMEHEISKHIPVIMMSSQESVNMVLKCMQKGAADYLIKPVRKNELRNLWQHVWRRKNSMVSGQVIENVENSQRKGEATAASNLSDDYAACIHETKGLSEKASDARNSCTTHYLEAESACVQNMQDISQLKYGNAFKLSNTYIEMLQEYKRLDNESVVHENEPKENSGTFGSDIVALDEALDSVASRLREEHTSDNTMVQDEGIQAEVCEQKAKPIGRTPSCHESVQPSGEVRDLLCAFDNLADSNVGISDSKDDGMKDVELELSLRSSDSSQMQVKEERPSLNHSDASAFSRYNNRRGPETFFSKLPSTNFKDASNSLGRQVKMINFVDVDTEQDDSSIQGPQIEIVSVAGDNMCAGNGHYFRSLFVGQSGLNPMLSSTKSVNHLTKFPFRSENCDDQSDINTDKFIDHTLLEKSKLDKVKHLKSGSPAQSDCSSLGNGTVNNQISGRTYGSISSSNDRNASSAVAGDMSTTSGSLNGCDHYVHGVVSVDSVRASQREAALIKFRLKRKDRCFEKKVRYQSRKILVEKRPRVKGQFVHNAGADSAAANAVDS